MKKTAKNETGRSFFRFRGQNAVLLVVLSFIILAFTLINPNFIRPYNLLSMVQSLVPYAVLALGVMFVIASGHTDLSVGAAAIAAAVMAGKLYELGLPLWTVIPLMIVFGAIIGALNGWLVAYLRVPAFIATLGTMMFVRGFSAIVVSDPNIFFPSGTWYNHLFSNWKGFPTGILWLLLFAGAAAYLIYKSRAGRYILAIGSNPEAARLCGIHSERYVFLAFLISGICAGLAGIFWSASFVTVGAATGNGMEFDAIAAVFIGGTSTAGGTAAVGGSLIGMIMLVVIRSGLNFALSRFNISVNSTYVTYVMTGIIIVGAILLDLRKKQLRPRAEQVLENHRPKLWLRIAAGVLALLLFAGAILQCIFVFRSEADNDRFVAVIAKEESNAFWENVRDGGRLAAEENGRGYTFRGPQKTDASSLPEALSLLQTAISNGAEAIAIAVNSEGFTDELAHAYDAGIPVVSYDSGVFSSDIETLDAMGKNPIVSFVRTDCYAAAALGAEQSFALVKDEIAASKDEYVVGVIQHELSSTAEDRSNGFCDRFRELAEQDPATKGKCQFYIEVKPDAQNNNYRLALEALAEKGADLVFCDSQVVAEQALDAIHSAEHRYDGVRFVSFDCGSRVVEWLSAEDGPVLLGSIAQDAKKMGYLAVEYALKAASGEEIEEEIIVDGVWFNAENVDELVEAGVVYLG